MRGHCIVCGKKDSKCCHVWIKHEVIPEYCCFQCYVWIHLLEEKYSRD